MAEEQPLFWADQIAKTIIERKKFHYIDSGIEKPKEFVVKTSASLSGVLHIGRLSDSVRGSTVYKALKDAGVKARIIWVAEDMDPLRKVPSGVPENFSQYIGMPVTDIPDPKGCHKSYAEHHKQRYFEVLDKFVPDKLQKFSMREEYKKGKFKPYIKKILENVETVVEIQNKFRENPLPPGWSPWTPICKNCGKIVTPQITAIKDGMVEYVCKDYQFEKTTAKGCGYSGVNNPMKDPGKLMWKSEWACQWAHWKISSEGAGKEYQVPNSAWWINGEIAEKVLGYPMPEPIFYEHIMVDGVKMSASLGNIVYPRDWLNVASPELLRFFYNKRLMATRSFSWKELPQLYDDYDYSGKVYYDQIKIENERERNHIKRLYELSALKKPERPLEMGFSHAAVICQIFSDKKDFIESLKKTGQYQKKEEKRIGERIRHARYWIEHHAPAEQRFSVQEKLAENLQLDEKQKQAIRMIVKALKTKKWAEKDLFNEFYNISKELELPPAELFKAGYRVLLNKERGPKLAPFILALGSRATKLLEQV